MKLDAVNIRIEYGTDMKSCKTYLGILMIVLYLFFPVTGLAFINHYLQDKGYSPVECSCCMAAGDQDIDTPFSGDSEESDPVEHGCSCSSHLSTQHFHPVPSMVRASLSLYDASRALPEVYFPIFVPPRNLF